jgi:hypothetical protein
MPDSRDDINSAGAVPLTSKGPAWPTAITTKNAR